MYKKKLLVSILFIFLSFFFSQGLVFAEDATPSAMDTSKQKEDLQKQLTELQTKISETRQQGKTLSSQIKVMDSQIAMTQLRMDKTQNQITQTQEDIQKATKRITSLEGSLNKVTKVLLARIVSNYETGQTQPLQVLLTAKDATDFIRKQNYLRIIQEHDQLLAYDTAQAKSDYAHQKAIFETQKKKMESLQDQLETYSKDLDKEKSSKKVLLDETKGSEANYQKQLARVQAQLASFSRFAQSQGGASLLGNQTSCDDWGCYYNQRDSQWGNLLINGDNNCGFNGKSEPCTVAAYGCLISSVAMVLSHMGYRDILPSHIATSGGNNFALGIKADLNKAISVNGLSIRRVPSGALTPENVQSNPLIVGVNAFGGTHFVVITKHENGQYYMNDPFQPGGKNIPFSYGSIFSVEKVVIN